MNFKPNLERKHPSSNSLSDENCARYRLPTLNLLGIVLVALEMIAIARVCMA